MQSDNPDQPSQPADPTTQQPAARGTCGTPLPSKCCYACGQPVNGLVRHFDSGTGDIADNLCKIDAQLFRTHQSLYLHPAKPTPDTFESTRAHCMVPFRLVTVLANPVFFAIRLTVRSDDTRLNKMVRITISPHTARDIGVRVQAAPRLLEAS